MQKRKWRTAKQHKDFLARGGPKGRGERRICQECKSEYIANIHNQKYCSIKCQRENEYFIKVYGVKYKLYKLRFQFVRNLTAFKREVENVKELKFN